MAAPDHDLLVLKAGPTSGISAAVLAASVYHVPGARNLWLFVLTWRLHMRGENIRGAHDVGRVRNLVVAAMMRKDLKTVSEGTSLATFCETFPLGSTGPVIALDGNGRYAGVVLVADAHHALAHLIDDEPQTVAALLRYTDIVLLPTMTAKEAAELFAASNSEELAVVDNAERRRVVGLLTEAYLLRRYAEELDKAGRTDRQVGLRRRAMAGTIDHAALPARAMMPRRIHCGGVRYSYSWARQRGWASCDQRQLPHTRADRAGNHIHIAFPG